MCFTQYTRDECNDCDTYHERMVTHRPCLKSIRTGQCKRSFDYKTIKRPNEDVDKCAKCLEIRTEAVREATMGEIRVDLTPFWRRMEVAGGGGGAGAGAGAGGAGGDGEAALDNTTVPDFAATLITLHRP